MKRGFLVMLATALSISLAWAQVQKAGAAADAKTATTVTLKGYVVDQSCGKGMAKKDNPMQKASTHSRDCALEDACSTAGYGLFSDGKWYVFDKAGSEKVKAALEGDKREKGLAYEVSGSLAGNMLTVSSVKATTLAAAKEKASEKPARMN